MCSSDLSTHFIPLYPSQSTHRPTRPTSGSPNINFYWRDWRTQGLFVASLPRASCFRFPGELPTRIATANSGTDGPVLPLSSRFSCHERLLSASFLGLRNRIRLALLALPLSVRSIQIQPLSSLSSFLPSILGLKERAFAENHLAD